LSYAINIRTILLTQARLFLNDFYGSFFWAKKATTRHTCQSLASAEQLLRTKEPLTFAVRGCDLAIFQQLFRNSNTSGLSW
jgi:hypothetical protein